MKYLKKLILKQKIIMFEIMKTEFKPLKIEIMKHFILLVILSLFNTFLFNSCKDKEDSLTEKTEPYLKAIYEFRVVDFGNAYGYCGPIIEAIDSNNSNTIIYKAVNLPSGISFSLDVKYRGVFEILPEKYKCMDSRPDPIPGKPNPTYYPNFVNILDWVKKQ